MLIYVCLYILIAYTSYHSIDHLTCSNDSNTDSRQFRQINNPNWPINICPHSKLCFLHRLNRLSFCLSPCPVQPLNCSTGAEKWYFSFSGMLLHTGVIGPTHMALISVVPAYLCWGPRGHPGAHVIEICTGIGVGSVV